MEDVWRECTTRAGFIQRIVHLCQRGYPYYISGTIREEKDPRQTDHKICATYAPELNKRRRAYRKSLGLENGQYLRHARAMVLLMTDPSFVLDVDKKQQVFDLRNPDIPLKVLDYSIGLRPDGSEKQNGRHILRVRVRLSNESYREEKAFFLEQAVHWSLENLGDEMWRRSSFHVKYKPIYRQWENILDAVNEKRSDAGLTGRVPYNRIRWYAPSPKHFGDVGPDGVFALMGEELAA